MSTYSQKAISGNPKKNNTGSIATTNTSNSLFNRVSYPQLTAGSKVAQRVQDNGIVDKAVSGNPLAVLTAGSYIVKGYSPSTQASPGSDDKSRRSYNPNYDIRTAHYVLPQPNSSGGWNYATGKPIQGYPVSGSLDTQGTRGTTNFPSRSVPGRFTILQTGKSTTTSSYEAKTS